MAQPVWITPAGNLGTIAEGIFFQLPLLAVDPDANTVHYELVAGSLPAGVQITGTGSVIGVPKAKAQGVPSEIGSEITSRFAIRAYVNTAGGKLIADRTFTLTVAGQDLPEFVTPAGTIGSFYEGAPMEYQIQFSDQDPGDNVIVSIISGSLAPGLTMTNKGLISGYVLPTLADATYTFTVKITDGKEQNLRTFSMGVINRDTLTADTTLLTADNTTITADETPTVSPFMTNYPTNGYIGLYRNSNYFAYQFKGVIFNGSTVAYALESGDIPDDLYFDGDTGWLYGNIKDYGITDLTFNFTVYIYDVNDPTNTSIGYDYSLEVIGPIENSVVWLNKSFTTTTDGSIDLGLIDNGSISLFTILAENTTGKALQFRLKEGPYPALPGVYNKLPQGLSLLPSGNIAGRVSFDTFALDGGKTTFDEQRDTRLIPDPTTFDMVYRFTVEAYSIDGLVSVFQLFSIRVVRAFSEPYNSIYIQAMPTLNDRSLLNDLLQNQDIMKPSLIFRQDDPYFGVARNVIYTHVYAIKTTELQNYVAAMDLNHFWKQLTLGEIKVAQALDANDNVVYEVVYSEIIDSGVNDAGESPGQSVPVPYPFDYEGETIKKVYPNSLIEMRNQVVAEIGNFPQVLPLWMRSKQPNGKVLNFVKAWVIAYAKPGEGKHLAYNINTRFGDQLNLVDFTADRYELDRQYSKNWIPPTGSTTEGEWFPVTTTTFDLSDVYTASVSLTGVGYVGTGPTYSPDNYSTNPSDPNYQGDTLVVSGAKLGGATPANDAFIRVTSITNVDTITIINRVGPNFEVGQIITSVPSNPMLTPAATGQITSVVGNTLQVSRFDSESPAFADGDSIRLVTPITTSAAYMVAGYEYTIIGPQDTEFQYSGSANFKLAGAACNEIGATFVANGPTYGTGFVALQTTAECDAVTTVSGIINAITVSGTPEISANGNSYANCVPTNIISSGSGAKFNIAVTSSTTFDDNSLQFNTPADKYGLTDEYNKYLLFPKTNILG